MLQFDFRVHIKFKNGEELDGIYRAKTSSLSKIQQEFLENDNGELNELQTIYTEDDYSEATTFNISDALYISFRGASSEEV